MGVNALHSGFGRGFGSGGRPGASFGHGAAPRGGYGQGANSGVNLSVNVGGAGGRQAPGHGYGGGYGQNTNVNIGIGIGGQGGYGGFSGGYGGHGRNTNINIGIGGYGGGRGQGGFGGGFGSWGGGRGIAVGEPHPGQPRPRPGQSYNVAFDPRASAGYDNAVGVYEVDRRGNISNPRLISDSAHDSLGGSTRIQGVRPGSQLGFFLVQNGSDWAKGLGSGAQLGFVGAQGGRANVGAQGLALTVNGKPAGQTVFHNWGSNLNADGINHARQAWNGQSGTIAFEDLTNGGDRDFNDVILHVDRNRSSRGPWG
ncbi:DUF4114 domain-containing protein [Neomegalonema sp.]|uniref:DUF4114 domain-containing protein n=1 Tax=Neomegalonema sp. TaxID=2039713 RepID=UPI00262172E5|nr:DUF4114 domain-containing protein [Neomegalonema sp.]MDD2867971.1 DUF4114 domain-containing protein [Neomegalonema sp.]